MNGFQRIGRERATCDDDITTGFIEITRSNNFFDSSRFSVVHSVGNTMIPVTVESLQIFGDRFRAVFLGRLEQVSPIVKSKRSEKAAQRLQPVAERNTQ